jgi:hypothetical protein
VEKPMKKNNLPLKKRNIVQNAVLKMIQMLYFAINVEINYESIVVKKYTF